MRYGIFGNSSTPILPIFVRLLSRGKVVILIHDVFKRDDD